MFSFIWRRVVVGFFILLGSTALSFALVVFSGDPLGDLAELRPDQKAAKIAQRTAAMHLDKSVVERYGLWLKEVGNCIVSPFTGSQCTLGLDRSSNPVAPMLGHAMTQTLRLVVVATILALVIGVIVGVVTAIRQYSVFDYLTTFVAFLCFSMPSFWVATLLKQFVAIDLNQWLTHPALAYSTITLIAIASGLLWMLVIGAPKALDIEENEPGLRGWVTTMWKKHHLTHRVIVFAIAAVATGAMIYILLVTGWFDKPTIGIGGIILTAIGSAFMWTALMSGFSPRKRQVLYTALITAVIGIVLYFALQPLLDQATWIMLILLTIAAIAVGMIVGRFIGGFNRSAAMKVGALTAVTIGIAICVDRLLATYPKLFNFTSGHPIATTGSETPNLNGDFWLTGLDQIAHLMLPTLALMLISFASYSRYTRATTLDTLGQDYVRTARSKGLAERTILVRHVFRNAMIPIMTIVALDFAAVLGGAVITETVFGWSGMGKLLQTSITNVDPNPMMACLLITATAAVLMNMIADIAYAFLDPRIRLS